MENILSENQPKRNIVIFGYNDEVRELLNDYRPESSVCVNIVTANSPENGELRRMEKKGYRFYFADIINCAENEPKEILSETNIDTATNVILFEKTSANLSILKIFALNSDDPDWKIRLPKGAKISCYCEDTAAKELIEEYYDGFKGRACYDLELFDIPELRVRKMFGEIPLYGYYTNKNVPLSQWNTKLLLVGFTSVGREILLQVMNLAVMHEKNSIEVDVFDSDIENKASIFANELSREAFDFDGSSIRMKPTTADGNIVFRFHNTNAFDIIRDNTRKSPYTYIVVDVDDKEKSTDCALKLKSYQEFDSEEVPLVTKTDFERRFAGFENINDFAFSGTSHGKSALTLDMIIDSEFYSEAKKINHIYNNILFTEKGENVRAVEEKDPDDEWNEMPMFKRNSSKAAAYHDKVKDVVFEKLAREYGVNLDEKLESLMGENGTLFRYNGTSWEIDGTDEEFIQKLKSDGFAYEIASLEHRRWCCYFASRGWHCDKRDNRLKRHPCIVTEEKLIETRPDMVKYDLMSLMLRYIAEK